MTACIGREQDLETLHGYFQAALQGRGTVVFITGEAGIGKTTLVNEFKARYIDPQNTASDDKRKNEFDIRFTAARCNDLAGKGESYAPFIEVMSQLATDEKAFGSKNSRMLPAKLAPNGLN